MSLADLVYEDKEKYAFATWIAAFCGLLSYTRASP